MVDKKVSVALVSYNGEKYIEEQITSILINLREQDELVISDDGSNDRTKEIILEYQKKDNRIRLTEGPRQGIKKNVEHALRQCSGEYIFIADQDDIWTTDKVQKVTDIFKQEGCHLVIHDAKVIQAEKKEKVLMSSFMEFRNSKAGIVKNIVKNSYIGCCMAIHADLKELVLPIPNNIEMHDQWIGILNDWKYKDSVFLKEPLLYYRRHGENNSQMTHYGFGRMLRNRVVFCTQFLARILKSHKRRM